MSIRGKNFVINFEFERNPRNSMTGVVVVLSLIRIQSYVCNVHIKIWLFLYVYASSMLYVVKD